MNDVAKTQISTKVHLAIEREGLSLREAGNILGFAQCYLSMMKKPDQWPSCPQHAFDKTLAWVNSGQTLREYEKKHGRFAADNPGGIVRSEEKSKEETAIKEAPKGKTETDHLPDVRKEILTAEGHKLSVNLAEIGWIIGQSKDGKSVAQISKKLKIYDKIVEKIVSAQEKADTAEQPEKLPLREKVIVDLDLIISVNGKKVTID